MLLVNYVLLLNLLFTRSVFGDPEEEQGVKYANTCEGNFCSSIYKRNIILFQKEIYKVRFRIYFDLGNISGSLANKNRNIWKEKKKYLQNFNLQQKIKIVLIRIDGKSFLHSVQGFSYRT